MSTIAFDPEVDDLFDYALSPRLSLVGEVVIASPSPVPIMRCLLWLQTLILSLPLTRNQPLAKALAWFCHSKGKPIADTALSPLC